MPTYVSPSPHDRFFKSAMSDPHDAQNFFRHYLPDFIGKQDNLNTLKLGKETFIEPELKASMAGLLYNIQFENVSNFLYILAEHQSTPDRFMLFRILKYLCRILDQYPKEAPRSPLPPIYPLLFFNGKTPYPYSTDFFALFGEQCALAQSLWLKPIQLIDIGQIPDEAIRQHAWAGLMEWFMKHIAVRNMLPYTRLSSFLTLPYKANILAQ